MRQSDHILSKISSQVPVTETDYFEFQAFTGSDQESTQAHALSASCSRQKTMESEQKIQATNFN